MIKSQSPISEHKRHDRGVIICWELHMDNNIFTVEQFRGYMKCSSCARFSCKHSRLAEQLEQNYQIENWKEKPGNCFFCGKLAIKRNGLAICFRCIS